MRGQKQNGESSDVVPFVRANGEAERSNNQLDQAGQAILQLVGRVADVAEGDTRQAMDKARISFTLLKTGSSNWRPRLHRTRRRPTMPSGGCTGSIQR